MAERLPEALAGDPRLRLDADGPIARLRGEGAVRIRGAHVGVGDEHRAGRTPQGFGHPAVTLDGPRPGAKEDETVRLLVEGIVVAEEGRLGGQGLELRVGLRHHPEEPGAGARGEIRFERIAAGHDEVLRDPHPPPGVPAGGPADRAAGPVREDHHPPAGLAEGLHRVDDAGHRLRPHVDHPVAVENERVETLHEGREPRRRFAAAPAARSRQAGAPEAAKDRLGLEVPGLRKGRLRRRDQPLSPR